MKKFKIFGANARQESPLECGYQDANTLMIMWNDNGIELGFSEPMLEALREMAAKHVSEESPLDEAVANANSYRDGFDMRLKQ